VTLTFITLVGETGKGNLTEIAEAERQAMRLRNVASRLLDLPFRSPGDCQRHQCSATSLFPVVGG
jgi:hypothetical protein